MPKIWCSECGTFVVGELVPGIDLLEQGYILKPPCAACEGCEKSTIIKVGWREREKEE